VSLSFSAWALVNRQPSDRNRKARIKRCMGISS
jgi:hypothetical protein